MSDHGHHPPTSFWRKYVFSTDHKVIGIQFLFSGLLFVILGALLALGVRYQLAWPNQDVPYYWMLPGMPYVDEPVSPDAPTMTRPAPEANIAHWSLGKEVTIKNETLIGDVTLPPGTKATLTGFPKGLAVTVPSNTIVSDEGGSQRTLGRDLQAFIDRNVVIGDHNYKPPARAYTVAGSTIRIPRTDAEPGYELTLEGSKIYRPAPGGSAVADEEGRVRMPVDAARTPLALTIPSQIVKVENAQGEVEEVQVPALTVEDEITADKVAYIIQSLTPDAYLTLFTMHASIMIFFVIIPTLVGAFGNFCVPLMIGAKDMAFPTLNMISFWVAIPAGILMLLSFWCTGGAAGGGWTMYPPLSEASYSTYVGTSLWILAVGLVGFSSITGALNYITTIINMRAPGMTLFRMPLTAWSILITASLALFSTPMLTAAMFMLLLDRWAGTMFFAPTFEQVLGDGRTVSTASGGQPILFQHLFWFYSHPAVYIMILPAMGIASDILATFARKPIFGYKPMVYAMGGITGLGFIVWGHHMFQSGMNPILGTTFMASTIMIAVPSAIKVFNWLGTLWGGNIQFTTPMLNALAFVSMFTIGGLSGIFMAAAPVDIQIHDTYFIVAHIHYVLFGGSIFGIFAGVYYWFPKMFGRQLNEKWGHIHFWMNLIAFNGTFFIMHIIGIGGHPRRYAAIFEYPQLEHLQGINVMMTIFAVMLGCAQLPFFYNFFASLPYKLSRAMAALFITVLVGPVMMGKTYWWTQAVENTGLWGVDWMAFSLAMLAGLGVAVAVTAIIFALWWAGRTLQVPAMLKVLLYPIFLPVFLAPLVFMKPDFFMWIGEPGLYQYRWLFLAVLALPGLAWWVLKRPRDEFGAAVGDNPWHANSLEWATSSPPPYTNFETIPTVYRGPYEYSSPAVESDYLPQTDKLAPGVVEPAAH